MGKVISKEKANELKTKFGVTQEEFQTNKDDNPKNSTLNVEARVLRKPGGQHAK